MAATQGKTFAVIADEAHSSQTGTASSALKQILSAEELADLADGGEYSSEDILAAQMSARTGNKGITFVAFTATPKPKTMELFGRLPHPDQPKGTGNLPAPFHIYSMRQAIEEGFILDVLKNYTPYRLAFQLASGGKEWDEKEVAVITLIFAGTAMTVLLLGRTKSSIVFDSEVGWRERGEYRTGLIYYMLWITGFLGAIYAVGFVLAVIIFFATFLTLHARSRWWATLIMVASVVVALATLSAVLNINLPNGLLQDLISLPWPLS